MKKRVLITAVISIMTGFSMAVAGDEEFAWKVDLKIDKEILVKLPIKDGRLAETQTEEGRRVYEPISVIPIKITVTNTGKRSMGVAANDFDLELLDPRGEPFREGSDYVWKEGRDELRKGSVLLKPGQSGNFTRTILVVHATPEDERTYPVKCGQPGQVGYAKTKFVAKVPRERGEPVHSDYFDSIVELHGGKTKACGVIFWYDARKKEAYVLTAGKFIGDKKEFTAKITYRQGKKLTKPEDHTARVVGSYEGEFAVLAFPLPKKPRFFPLADKNYDYSSHPELVCVRWNEKEGMTARFVAPRGFNRGTLSVYYSEPANGISGAGLFDRNGRLVGIGWGAPSSPHSGRLGLFVSVRDIYPFFEKAKFKLPPRGIIGVTVSAADGRGGIHLDKVDESGPAAKVGLNPSDIIEAVDGMEVVDVDRFIDIIRFSEGCELILRIRRGEEKLPIRIVVGKKEAAGSKNEVRQKNLRKTIKDEWHGL
jgi:hypothetical protein